MSQSGRGHAPSVDGPPGRANYHVRLTTACIAAIWLVTAAVTASAQAQNPDQLGGQARADAASELIVLAVERAIGSLPPTAGQSVTYEYDPATDALERTERLGPTALRSAETVGPRTFSLQLATSYFSMAQSFGPINYLFTPDDPANPPIVAKLGLDADAWVTLINIAATYGLTQRLQVSASLPITIVNAHASQVFSTRVDALSLPPREAPLSGATVIGGDVEDAIRALDAGLPPGKFLALRRESLSGLGFDFNDGTHAGVGRITLGGKGLVFARSWLEVAGMTELLLPSPSEAEFAGPASVAIFPRLVTSLKLADPIRMHSDVGYEYDFSHAELRRFSWNSGVSYAAARVALDLGVGGSEYAEAIAWTPSTVHALPPTTGQALEDNTAGDQVVDFLFGLKFRLTDSTVIAGAVTVPVVNTDFQPDVLGTVAAEFHF